MTNPKLVIEITRCIGGGYILHSHVTEALVELFSEDAGIDVALSKEHVSNIFGLVSEKLAKFLGEAVKEAHGKT